MRAPPAATRRGDGASAGSDGSDKKAASACRSKAELKKGQWTAEEDEVLAGYIRREGEGRWRTLPKKAGLLRCGKSCRLRWMNYLRPSVKRGHITSDEEDLILRLHRLLGNRWSLIAGRIPGRTDNEIKNYWNTHLSKKLISQGIDPKTHKLSNPNPSTDSIDYKKDYDGNVMIVDNVQRGDVESTTNDDQDDGLKKKSRDSDDRTMSCSVIDQDGDVVVDDDDVMNTCFRDDAFSSFLNSLINDDS